MSLVGGDGSLARVARFAAVLAGVAACAPANAVASDGAVGHTVKTIQVPGWVGTSMTAATRPVDVHIWYPADAQDAAAKPKAVYTSALYDKPLPNGWAPLSWTIKAENAREGAAFDAGGGPYAPIVFSHGANNDPFDYADTLEAIARAGFVVLAPGHTNNTQDDVRIDYINALAGTRLFPCLDGLPARPIAGLTGAGFPSNPVDCAKSSVPDSMAERLLDVDAVLDALPAWFGDDVDVDLAGMLGHSRGTVTALAAAGGTIPWRATTTQVPTNCFGTAAPPNGQCWPGVQPEPRVKAVMGMAIGAAAINNSVNLAGITVPTLLLAGEKDRNTVPANTAAAFNAIPATTDKRQIDILDATHRTFDSTYCDQLQSAAGAFDTDHDGRVDAGEAADTNRPLDRWNIGLIGASFPGHLSGKAVHYCTAEELTTPVNIRRALASWPNAEYGCPLDTRPEFDAECGWIPHTLTPPTNQPGVCRADVTTPPCTTLSADDLKPRVVTEAVEFFGPRLYGTTPPELTVPADFSINATGPSGATVPFTATATDDLDPDPTVTCAPPSGSVFAMGPTTVTCIATDNGGNATEKTFTVTVLDAKAQLSNLIGAVVGSTGLPRAVKTQLTAALQSLLTGFDPARPLHRAAACLSLRTFTTIVRVLAPAQATVWIADANRIRAVLAC